MPIDKPMVGMTPHKNRSHELLRQLKDLRRELTEAKAQIHRDGESIVNMDATIVDLKAENERLKERCASDPWWWGYAEYLDEGWCGPFQTREEAEANADEALGPLRPDDDPPRCADDERPELTFRQAMNSEGCMENERLQAEYERLRGAAELACVSMEERGYGDMLSFENLRAALTSVEKGEEDG